MKTHFAYKPKTQPLPKTLFMRYDGLSLYKQVSTKEPKVLGFMDAAPNKICGKNFFHIYYLFVKEQRQGYGKEFIEFAKNISKQLGCEGRLFLMADSEAFGAKKPPHIFYRKQGLTTSDTKYLKKIDSYIKLNKEMKNKEAKPIYMYYVPENLTIGQKIRMRLIEFFKFE